MLSVRKERVDEVNRNYRKRIIAGVWDATANALGSSAGTAGTSAGKTNLAGPRAEDAPAKDQNDARDSNNVDPPTATDKTENPRGSSGVVTSGATGVNEDQGNNH